MSETINQDGTPPFQDPLLYACCENAILFKTADKLICKNCGMEFDGNEPDVNNQVPLYSNSCVNVLYKSNYVKKIYINDKESYKIIRCNTLLTFLMNKNKRSEIKLHENILKQTVDDFVLITNNKILRANNRIECLSYILFRKCIDFNNPKTITFIVNYMELPKGGFSRGYKRIDLLINNDERNVGYVILNVNDDMIKLKSYTEKMILIEDEEDSVDLIYPLIIKLYNFTNKLGVFNDFRNDTKITGCIWYVIKTVGLKINNAFFKKNKIEKNTIKKFYKKVNESMYNQYYDAVITEMLGTERKSL